MKRSVLLAFLLVITFAAAAHAQSSANGKVFWRGSVDDKAHVVVTGTSIEMKTVSGKENAAGRYSFTAPLPSSAVTVNVTTKEGRAAAVVIQQPIAENNFTAIIEINDSKGGSDEFLLEIYW